MPITINIKDDDQIDLTFLIANFSFGLGRLKDKTEGHKYVAGWEGLVHPILAWEKFTFIHDLDAYALELEKAIEVPVTVDLRMTDDKKLGGLCFVHLNFQAAVVKLETKPIKKYGASLEFAGDSESAEGQIVTMNIIDEEKITVESDVPKRENGQLVPDGTNSFIFQKEQ